MGRTRIENSDRGHRAVVTGGSMTTGRFYRNEPGTIAGVSDDGQGGEVVEVQMDSTGRTEKFRQNEVSGTRMR